MMMIGFKVSNQMGLKKNEHYKLLHMKRRWGMLERVIKNTALESLEKWAFDLSVALFIFILILNC